jgi:glutamate dehydrogenase
MAHERERTAWRLIDDGVPEEVARRHAYQQLLVHGPNVIAVSERTGRSTQDVARAFVLVGEALYVDWVEARLREVPAASRWHRWAIQVIEDDLHLLRAELAERVLGLAPGAPVDEALDAFLASSSEPFARLTRFMRSLALEEASELAAVTVAVRKIRSLAA